MSAVISRQQMQDLISARELGELFRDHSPSHLNQAARHTRSQPAKRCVLPPANPTHQPPETLPEHHELLAAAFNGPLRTPAAAAEGPLSGVRSRCWNRLRGYLNSTAQHTQGNLLWDPTTLDTALDALSRRPLLRDAREKVATALQEHSDDNLAALVADLHTRNELCVPEATEIAPPHIICSMGLTR